MEINQILSEMAKLDTYKLNKFIEIINKKYSYEFNNELISDLSNYEVTYCPYCHSLEIIKNGKQNKSQRYLCKKCGKRFSTSTSTIFFKTHKTKDL
jgi:transposase-like protein